LEGESEQGRLSKVKVKRLTKVVTLNLDSRSYAAFSTKPKDRVRRSKLIAKYGLSEGIERFALGETV
jgi:type IV secretion system protein VirB4